MKQQGSDFFKFFGYAKNPNITDLAAGQYFDLNVSEDEKSLKFLDHNKRQLAGENKQSETWDVNGVLGNTNVYDIVYNLEGLQQEHVNIKIHHWSSFLEISFIK